MTQSNKVVVFDLDDTLYKEIDFLKSGFHEISRFIGIEDSYQLMLETYYQHGNPFETIILQYKLNLTIDVLINLYRNHKPILLLNKENENTLFYLYNKYPLGLITDGRSITQRNKIYSLGLYRFFENTNIIISEEIGASKLSEKGFRFFMDKYPQHYYYYIADNTQKDFITPNSLGWNTICLLDNGDNIHQQCFNYKDEYLPKQIINNLCDIQKYL